jgi:serine/threonine protein phosphatase PrpC
MSASLHDTVPIHPTPEQIPQDAVEYMNGLHGEMETGTFLAGWDTRQKEGAVDNDDSMYVYADDQTGVAAFAIWDGVGGQPGGSHASSAARQGLHEFMLDNQGTQVHLPTPLLKNAFELMNERAKQEAPGSATTALVAIMHPGQGDEAGKKILEVGAAGDSLGFIVRKNGNVEPMNREETYARAVEDENLEEIEAARKEGRRPDLDEILPIYGTYISNSLGTSSNGEDGFAGLNEKHRIVVEDGDVLVLTSDGITGDNDNQRLRGGDNEAVIRAIARDTDISPLQKAQYLIEAATKKDDRTAIVIEVGDYMNSGRHGDTVSTEWKRNLAAVPAGATALR